MTETPETPQQNIVPELWERQPDESEEAFRAFVLYRDMGLGNRSHASVNEAVYDGKNNQRLIAEWSRTHDWVARVRAFDAYQDEKRRERNVSRQVEVEENAYTDYQFLRMKITNAIAAYEAASRVKVGDIRILLVLMREADDYARRAVGLPDRITQSQNQTQLQGNLTVTDIRIDDIADLMAEMAAYEQGDDDEPST